MRPYIMDEFAKNGAKHLVLSDEFICRMQRTPNFANTLRTEMANAGLTFVDSHAPFGWWEDMDVPVESARPLMLERLRLAMRIVAQFEVDTITIHVGNAPACFGDEYSLDYYHTCILRSIEALLPLAEELKMVICVENIWTPLNTAEKLLDMIDHFKSPYLGICYDAGHANLMIDHGYDDCNAVNAFARYGLKPPYDDKGNLILLDWGEENFYATAYFMDKKPFEGAYLVDYYQKLEDKVSITPLFEATRGRIIFEFENKRLPKTGIPDYGVNFSIGEEKEKKFYPVKNLDVGVSNEAVFAMRFDELNELSYYDFSHPVIEEGEYEFNLFYVADECGTDVTFFIDGENVGTFSVKSPYQSRRVFSIYRYFEKGNHEFKIVPKSGNSCIMIDSVTMDLIAPNFIPE